MQAAQRQQSFQHQIPAALMFSNRNDPRGTIKQKACDSQKNSLNVSYLPQQFMLQIWPVQIFLPSIKHLLEISKTQVRFFAFRFFQGIELWLHRGLATVQVDFQGAQGSRCQESLLSWTVVNSEKSFASKMTKLDIWRQDCKERTKSYEILYVFSVAASWFIPGFNASLLWSQDSSESTSGPGILPRNWLCHSG